MRKIFSIIILFGTTILGFSQYRSIPMDTAVCYGKLENGLTYYIRHNEWPKDRGCFYIVQNVGAILEEDSQNGLAHFLEHMAFNGTKNFPKKGIIEYMESIGAQFGTNLNAYTSLDETVYMLRDIPTIRESIVDSALLILHDWSGFISLEAEEIDKERGVIREEWRTGATANRRMWKEGNKQKYPNSQYAKRDVIGDTAVINHFAYDTLRAYYKKWYRPDLQAIVVVGDVNVALVEEKIKSIFADIPLVENPAERIFYPIQENEEPIVSIVTDQEATASVLGVEMKYSQMPKAKKMSQEGYLEYLSVGLIETMFQNRLEKEVKKKDCPFVESSVQHGSLNRLTDVFAVYVVSKPGKERESFRELLEQIEKVRRYGFLSTELERAKKDFLAIYTKAYNERKTNKSRNYVQEYVNHFLENEPTPGIAWEYVFVQYAFDQMIDSVVINRMIPNYIHSYNMIIDISAAEKDKASLPTKEEVLKQLSEVSNSMIKAYEEKRITTPLLDKKLKSGTIVKESKNDILKTTEWTLSNGIKVILKPTDFKKDEILLSAFSAGGTSTIADSKQLLTASVADDIIANNGLGKLDNEQLSEVLSGKIVSVMPYISTYEEGLSGSSTIKDFETLLQLAYLRFMEPRTDSDSFDLLMSMFATQLENKTADSRLIFSDSLSLILSNHSDRTIIYTKENIKGIKEKQALEVYKKRFKNPADFVFCFVGSFDIDSVKPQILKYLGSLKTSNKRESWIDNGVRYPKGMITNHFEQKMEVEKSSVYLHFWNDMPFNLENSLKLSVLSDILDIRYTESLREEEGGTYGASVRVGLSEKPQEQATLSVRFDTNPEKFESLIAIAKKEIQQIAQHGPTIEDLEKVKKNLLKSRAEHLRENSWWLSTIKIFEMDGIDRVSDYEQMILALTQDDIRQICRALLVNENVIEVVMSPKK